MSPTFSADAAVVAVVLVTVLLGAVIDGVQSAAVDCSKLKTMDNFNITGMQGDWYEALVSENQDIADKFCLKDVYFSNRDGMNIVSRTIDEQTYTFKITFNADTPAILSLKNIEASIQKPFTEYVLDTDYESYAIIVNCEDDDENEFYTRVFSREKQLSADADTKVRSVLKANNIEYDSLDKIQQSGC